MFEDSILESSGRLKSHRGWSTLASSALQVLFLVLLALLPVLHPEALSRSVTPIAGPTPYAPVERPRGPVPSPIRSAVIARPPGALVAPSQIPVHVLPGDDNPGPPSSAANIGPLTGPGSPDGIPGAPAGLSEVLRRPPVAVAPPRRVVISALNEGNLIYRVEPAYPPLAKAAGVQGEVALRAIISRDGNIEQLQALSGHPLLVPAALDAVRQWRYRPYLLNGQPVEVETQITVRFLLSRH